MGVPVKSERDGALRQGRQEDKKRANVKKNKTKCRSVRFPFTLQRGGRGSCRATNNCSYHMSSALATTVVKKTNENSKSRNTKVCELDAKWVAEGWRETNLIVQLDDHFFGPSRAQELTLARFVDKDAGQNCEQTPFGHGPPAFVKVWWRRGGGGNQKIQGT